MANVWVHANKKASLHLNRHFKKEKLASFSFSVLIQFSVLLYSVMYQLPCNFKDKGNFRDSLVQCSHYLFDIRRLDPRPPRLPQLASEEYKTFSS